MELQKGCPDNTAGRLDKELRVYRLLDSLGVEYYRMDHEAGDTMEALKDVHEALGAMICKNLMLCNRQCTDFYLLLIPGDKPFKTKNLSKQIGSSRLSFAPAEYMEAFLDITPGSVSVMGLMNDRENRVKLLIDKDVLGNDRIGCHPCINTSSIRLNIQDLLDTVLPAMGHAPTFVELPWETE